VLLAPLNSVRFEKKAIEQSWNRSVPGWHFLFLRA
jgi:hypothetical protein